MPGIKNQIIMNNIITTVLRGGEKNNQGEGMKVFKPQ